MADLKTRPTGQDVEAFLNGVADERRRRDSLAVLELMKEVTGHEPRMWGSSIVGFGDYHYKYASGREGDVFLTGFSPRKEALTLYLGYNVAHFQDVLQRLGKFKTGKGCLYIKDMEDVDVDALRELIARSVQHLIDGPAGQ